MEKILNEEDILKVEVGDNGYDLVIDKPSNGYKFYTVDWKEIPRYDIKGNLLTSEAFKEMIIEKNGEVFFNQNYACEFVGSSYTLINQDTLKSLTSMDPIEIRDGKLKIYKYPQENHNYIISVDPAKDGKDAFAIQILDITTYIFEEVAAAKLQVDYLIMPEFLDDWCKYYNNAYLIIENNEGAGQSIADTMKNSYEYTNIHHDRNLTENKRKKYPGFRTTTHNRGLILNTLRLFLETENLILHDRDTINEFYTFVLIKNKYQADDGCHDDMIMSLAIAFAPFCNVRNFEDIKPIIKELYNKNESLNSNDKFSDHLIIGNFDDNGDDEFEEYQNSTHEYDFYIDDGSSFGIY